MMSTYIKDPQTCRCRTSVNFWKSNGFEESNVFLKFVVVFLDTIATCVPHVPSPSSPQVCLGCAELCPEFRCSRCGVARFCSKAKGLGRVKPT